MDLLQDQPKLGHITTFGGHPVIAASALATLKEITTSNLMQQALEKERLFRKLLVHPLIKESTDHILLFVKTQLVLITLLKTFVKILTNQANRTLFLFL